MAKSKSDEAKQAASEQNEKDQQAVESESPDATSSPADAGSDDARAEQTEAAIQPAEEQGSERNTAKPGTEAYGDQPLSQTTLMAQPAEHRPGAPLETQEDHDANEELRQEREERTEAQKSAVADDLDLDEDDVVVNGLGEVVPVQPSHTLLGGVDARSPEANVLSRDNIIADGVGTATPILTRGLDEDGNEIENESIVEFEAREREAERVYELDRVKAVSDLNEQLPNAPVIGPR